MHPNKEHNSSPDLPLNFMLGKFVFLLSGNAAASLLLLLRNLLVARLIPLADYGVAATFAVLMTAVEMATELGLKQQIVQSKQGDDERFQAALQAFQLMRGFAAGAILFILASPMAAFFGIPEAAWAYQVLAIVPMLKAAEHFDVHRLNRQMRFGPMLWSGVIPPTVTLALVWPLALWLGDWRVMLWSLIVQAVMTVVASHLLAERHYRLIWDSAIMVGALRFGWPLLINAALLFVAMQGDKLIVGRFLGLEALAIFAMGMTLTLAPTLVMAKSAQNLFLPRLSAFAQAQDMAQRFRTHARITLQVALLNGALVILVFSVLGGGLIHLVLGAKYAELMPLIALFGLLNGLRVFKTGPAVVALSRGVSSNAMFANLPRVLALPIAVWMLMNGSTIEMLLWLGIIAEGVGFLLALGLMRARAGQGLSDLLPVWGALGFFLSACGVSAVSPTLPPLWHSLGLVAAFLILAFSMRDLYSQLLRVIGKRN